LEIATINFWLPTSSSKTGGVFIFGGSILSRKLPGPPNSAYHLAGNNSHMPPIPVEGSYNIRDLGGYPTREGRTMRSGLFIRAGNLAQVISAGAQQLLGFGAKTIIDLRDEWEVGKYLDAFVPATPVKYTNLSFIGNSLSSTERW